MQKEITMGGDKICVTGAGGYIASWVVKFLLSKGYNVHGTVRDPSDPKNSHLKILENAQQNLQLFKADLLDFEGLLAAIEGCTGVIHLASPVPYEKALNPEVEICEPALTGTKNVLNASLKADVKKVIVVSSITAVAITQAPWLKDQAMDETYWSDLEYCKSREHWYCAAKTMVEIEAWDFSKRTGLNVVTICPSIVIGPMLQPTLNASCLYLLGLMEGTDPFECIGMSFVDVRDAAEAILLVYENPEAEGRYICSSYEMPVQDLIEMLKEIYSEYDYQESYKEVQNAVKLSSLKLLNLGWKYRAFEETLVDAIHNYKEVGLLSIKTC